MAGFVVLRLWGVIAVGLVGTNKEMVPKKAACKRLQAALTC